MFKGLKTYFDAYSKLYSERLSIFNVLREFRKSLVLYRKSIKYNDRIFNNYCNKFREFLKQAKTIGMGREGIDMLKRDNLERYYDCLFYGGPKMRAHVFMDIEIEDYISNKKICLFFEFLIFSLWL